MSARVEHVIDRARQRYGVDLSPADVRAIEMQVGLGDGELVGFANRSARFIRVAWAGADLMCLVSAQGFVITVYPPGRLPRYGRAVKSLEAKRARRQAQNAEREYEREEMGR